MVGKNLYILKFGRGDNYELIKYMDPLSMQAKEDNWTNSYFSYFAKMSFTLLHV